jgi:hypothetical protein
MQKVRIGLGVKGVLSMDSKHSAVQEENKKSLEPQKTQSNKIK